MNTILENRMCYYIDSLFPMFNIPAHVQCTYMRCGCECGTLRRLITDHKRRFHKLYTLSKSFFAFFDKTNCYFSV